MTACMIVALRPNILYDTGFIVVDWCVVCPLEQRFKSIDFTECNMEKKNKINFAKIKQKTKDWNMLSERLTIWLCEAIDRKLTYLCSVSLSFTLSISNNN